MADENELRALAAENARLKNELKDHKLWTPLKEMFIGAGGDPVEWDIARLDLRNQKRFDLDDDGDIVLMQEGKPNYSGAEQFFRDAYKRERPKFYKGTQQEQKLGENTITRAQFDGLNPKQKADHVKSGGRIVD